MIIIWNALFGWNASFFIDILTLMKGAYKKKKKIGETSDLKNKGLSLKKDYVLSISNSKM